MTFLEQVMWKLERLEALILYQNTGFSAHCYQNIGFSPSATPSGEVSCVDPILIAESPVEDSGCFLSDSRLDGADGHAHQKQQGEEHMGMKQGGYEAKDCQVGYIANVMKKVDYAAGKIRRSGHKAKDTTNARHIVAEMNAAHCTKQGGNTAKNTKGTDCSARDGESGSYTAGELEHEVEEAEGGPSEAKDRGKEKLEDKEAKEEAVLAGGNEEAKEMGPVKEALMKVLKKEKQKKPEERREDLEVGGMSRDNQLLLNAFKDLWR